MSGSVFITLSGKLKIKSFIVDHGQDEWVDVHDWIGSEARYFLRQLSLWDVCYHEHLFNSEYFADNVLALVRVIARKKLCEETQEEMAASMRFIEATFMDDEVIITAKMAVRRLVDHLDLTDEQMTYVDDLFANALFENSKREATRH